MLFYVLIVIFGFLLYLRGTRNFDHWKKKGVPYKTPFPYVGTNFQLFMRRITSFQNIVNDYNYYPNEKVLGLYFFQRPVLLVKDPELIKQIGIKAFDNFMDHTQFSRIDMDDIFNKNLVALTGKRWKEMRSTLSPAFTSSKMKMMFDLISKCGEQMADHFIKLSQKGDDKPLCFEMKKVFTYFTNDVIATAAFGITVDTFKNPDHEFYRNGKKLSEFSGWKFLLISLMPKIMKLLGIQILSKSATNYFQNIIKGNIKEREEKDIDRPDVIHLLMQARKGMLEDDKQEVEETGFATVTEHIAGLAEKKDKLDISDDDIVAQAIIFFAAGFDTSSTLLTFISYELAINPDVQKTLQEEIDMMLESCNGKITYQGLFKMRYLDMVVSETLRKWPPGPALDRVCTKSFVLETPERHIKINEGTMINIPVYALQHDAKYFPDPVCFIPDRFSDENKNNIHPYTYMPFGIGPRNCIGSRFALMECKIALFHLLSKFDFVVTQKTEIPIKIKKDPVRVISDHSVWLELKPRDVLKDLKS